ncbi:lipolytic protein G-D-S-L family [Myxosarcina sp. GI1]|uniref:lipolytic protein G-D-S-L family n=1 Tax=Myxosarcina sp. GI1 TaxID=1541065 RepID=UPI00055AF19B|nr:lipolytic protein G-D-S-L family [Myxosarcina sp. GI1]
MVKRPKKQLIFAKRTSRREPKLSWLWTIASVILFLLVLELLTRVVVDVTGNRAKFTQAPVEPDLARAYQLKFVSETGEPYETLENEGSLVAKRSLSVGYQLEASQNSQYWEINQQGFRDREPVLTTKPKDEIRIFVIGGSTAFGYGSSSNETTVGEYLEARLQQRIQQQQDLPKFYQPDSLPVEPKQREAALVKPAKIKSGQYRVINAAVPGYASGNELAQLALQILNYNPDIVIALDGYSDLMLNSNEKAVDIPQLEEYLDNGFAYFKAYVSRSLEPLEKNSYLVQIVQNNLLDPENSQKPDFYLNDEPDALVNYLPEDEAELASRVDRYYNNHLQILKLCAAAQIPTIVATQPEITGQDPSRLTEAEGAITTQLGREYIQTVKNIYPEFIAASQKLANTFPSNVRAVDSYNLSDKYPSPSFIDPTHLTDEANQQLAEQLYYAVAALPKLQIEPSKPPVKSQSKRGN